LQSRDRLENDFGQRIVKLENDFGKRIDEQSKKIEEESKRIDELSAKIDRNSADYIAKLDAKIDPLEKDLIQMNTRIAVIESRLSDISTNVTYLMWHSQAIPPREEIKEN
jgi:uncharacterized coiled-coil DUF342 family protein